MLEQHRRIRELFMHVKRAVGRRKQQAFDELRILPAGHETAKEMVLRPVSCQDAGAAVVNGADARNQEEREATRTLSVLETVNVSSAELDRMLTEFEQVVLDQAEREEQEEFSLCAPGNPGPRWPGWARCRVPRRRPHRPNRIPRLRARRSRSGWWGRGPPGSTGSGMRSTPPSREADAIGKTPPGSFEKSRARTGQVLRTPARSCLG